MKGAIITDEAFAKKIENENVEKSKMKKKANDEPTIPQLRPIDSDSDATEEYAEERMSDPDSECSESPIKKFVNYWRWLSPPTQKSEVQQTWCACVYSANKKKILYIGRILKRFLKDVDGPCTKVEINCCMKEQSGTFGVYENVPSHLPKLYRYFRNEKCYIPGSHDSYKRRKVEVRKFKGD